MTVTELKGIDVLVLHFLNYKTNASNLEQVFWKDRYFVDPKKSFKTLIDNEFIEQRKDVHISLTRLTTAELKDILKNNELKISGKKQELVERIIEEANPVSYSNYLSTVEVLTSKALELLSNTQYILDVHNTFQEFSHPNALYDFANANPERTDLEIICKFIEEYIRINKTPSVAYTYKKLGDISFKYNDIEQCIDYLVKACFSYLTDVKVCYTEPDIEEKYIWFTDIAGLPTYFTNDLSKILSNDKENITLFNKSCTKYRNKKHYIFDVKEIKEIILSYINNDENEREAIYKEAFNRTLSGTNPLVTDLSNRSYTYDINEVDNEEYWENDEEENDPFEDFKKIEKPTSPTQDSNKLKGCFGCLSWTFIIMVILYVISLFM